MLLLSSPSSSESSPSSPPSPPAAVRITALEVVVVPETTPVDDAVDDEGPGSADELEDDMLIPDG